MHVESLDDTKRYMLWLPLETYERLRIYAAREGCTVEVALDRALGFIAYTWPDLADEIEDEVANGPELERGDCEP